MLAEGWDGYGSPPASAAYICRWLWNALMQLPEGGGGGGGGDTTGLAPLDLPTFIGTPSAPMLVPGDNSSRLATTAMVQAALSVVSGGLHYRGTWNAATNIPTLSNSSGISNSGGFYVVSVAGTTPLNGITSWAVGDWCISDDVGWKKIIQTDVVSSVFGRTGLITASPGDYNADQVTETATRKIMTAAERTQLTGLNTALALLAPLASPTLTGDPKAPTPTAGDSDTSIATTAFVAAAVAVGATLPVKDVRTFGAVGNGIANDTTARYRTRSMRRRPMGRFARAEQDYLVNDLTMQNYGKLIGNGAEPPGGARTTRVQPDPAGAECDADCRPTDRREPDHRRQLCGRGDRAVHARPWVGGHSRRRYSALHRPGPGLNTHSSAR